jgi:hypothetical protein
MSVDAVSKSTYISIGLAITIVAATWIICAAIYSTNSHIDLAVTTMTNKIDAIDVRVTALTNQKETWTESDMYKWSIHLQQANQKLNPPLNVPEPVHSQ